MCHGFNAISGGVITDLRKSSRLQDPELWREAVLDGTLVFAGMPSFGDMLTAEEAELLRSYVAIYARATYEMEQQAATPGSPE